MQRLTAFRPDATGQGTEQGHHASFAILDQGQPDAYRGALKTIYGAP